MIAEEKEKNTLRGLLLSPLNTFEIFIGKSLLSFLLTVLMIVIVTLISQFEVPANVLLYRWHIGSRENPSNNSGDKQHQ